MISVNSIMNALFTMLTSDSTLVNSNVSIDFNAEVNQNPNRAPWVGIYNGTLTELPQRLNINEPWTANLQPIIIAQEQLINTDTQDLSNRINSLRDHILTIVNSDRSIKGTIDNLIEINSELFRFDLDEVQNNFNGMAYEIILTMQKLV